MTALKNFSRPSNSPHVKSKKFIQPVDSECLASSERYIRCFDNADDTCFSALCGEVRIQLYILNNECEIVKGDINYQKYVISLRKASMYIYWALNVLLKQEKRSCVCYTDSGKFLLKYSACVNGVNISIVTKAHTVQQFITRLFDSIDIDIPKGIMGIMQHVSCASQLKKLAESGCTISQNIYNSTYSNNVYIINKTEADNLSNSFRSLKLAIN